MLPLIALAVVLATPATLPEKLAAARPGDTVRLDKGSYAQRIVVPRKTYNPPLLIDARAATITGNVVIAGTDGLQWLGGDLTVPHGKDVIAANGYGFNLQGVKNVLINKVRISGANKAIVVAGRSENVTITQSTLQDIGGDGIIISATTGLKITDNRIGPFLPPVIYDTGPAHQDAIQLFTRYENKISDVVITGNEIRGGAQGIYAGNRPDRKPNGDPGFERVTIENNRVASSMPNGIVVVDCEDCSIRFNHVSTLDGARWRSKVLAVRGSGAVCDNVVTALPKSDATRRCK